MHETSKSKAIWSELELGVLKGKGIDVGSGPDPVFDTARKFDVTEGDANEITRYVSETFDYVYSSHCLEHMHDTAKALAGWWQLVKPGGHLFFVVPEEDLYEQGYFPSLFNRDHKATFTIYKEKSWSPVSRNVRDLAAGLPGGEIVSLDLQDNGYDRALCHPLSRRPGWLIHSLYCVYVVLNYAYGPKWTFLDRWIRYFHPIDQTMRPGTLAQVRCIVKKLA